MKHTPKKKPLGAYGIIKCLCGKITSVEHALEYHQRVTFESKLNKEK